MAKSKRVSPVETFSKPRVTKAPDHCYDGRPLGMRSRCLFRAVDFLHAEFDGIDSMTEGHWIIDFHRSIFAHLQCNSEMTTSHTSGGGR